MIQFHRESNNCFQDVVAMILINNGRDPVSIYRGSLNFGYNLNEEIFGNRITPSRDGNWLDCSLMRSLQEDNGIVLYLKETVGIKSFLKDLISTNKQGVILKVDVYDCDWHVFFHKYHLEHYCWVIGCEDAFLKCALPYGQQWGYYPIESLLNTGTVHYYTYEFQEKGEDIKIVDVIVKSIYDCEKGWNGISDISQMIVMRNDIAKAGISLKKEMVGCNDIVALPVIRAFEWLAWSRINYRDYLNKNSKKDEVNCLITTVDKAAKTWLGIKNYIMREIIRGNEEVNYSLVKHIDSVIDVEKYIIDEMKKIKDLDNEV